MTKSLILTTLFFLAASAYAGDKHDDDKKPKTIYRTNYVQVQAFCAAIEVSDFNLLAGHTYRLMVADGAKPWRTWATLRPTTNTNARIWMPPASIRPVQWQLIDNTPGFPVLAVVKQAPDCVNKPQWISLGIGNLRPVR